MIAAIVAWWRADSIGALQWIVGSVVVAGVVVTVGRGWLEDHNALAAERLAHVGTKAELERAQRNEGHLETALESQNLHVDAIASDCTIRAADVDQKVQAIIRRAPPPPAASRDADSMNLYLQQLRSAP